MNIYLKCPTQTIRQIGAASQLATTVASLAPGFRLPLQLQLKDDAICQYYYYLLKSNENVEDSS